MLKYKQDPLCDCIVVFKTNGWQSHFFAAAPASFKWTCEDLDHRIPESVRSQPLNDKVIEVKVYRLESTEKREQG